MVQFLSIFSQCLGLFVHKVRLGLVSIPDRLSKADQEGAFSRAKYAVQMMALLNLIVEKQEIIGSIHQIKFSLVDKAKAGGDSVHVKRADSLEHISIDGSIKGITDSSVFFFRPGDSCFSLENDESGESEDRSETTEASPDGVTDSLVVVYSSP